MNDYEQQQRFLDGAMQLPKMVTWEQFILGVQIGAERALQNYFDYESKFDALPDRIRTIEVANFLGVTQQTVITWRKKGKLNFTILPGKNPYITKRQFIQDCMKHKLK